MYNFYLLLQFLKNDSLYSKRDCCQKNFLKNNDENLFILILKI